MLEAAALGVVPVFGPLTDNFQEEAQLLLDAGAAERVADEADWPRRCCGCCASRESARSERGKAARRYSTQGASRRHWRF